MKFLIAAFLVIVSFSIAYCQKIDYEQWQNESKENIRLLPEYGNLPKTTEQKQFDAELISSEVKQEGTPRKASDHLIDIGFKYLGRGDIKTAMYRFNQAWLVDPHNENVYWGFGAIYFRFNDVEKSLEQYDRGLKINPNSSNILTDKATIYLEMVSNKFDKVAFDKALTLFQKSYSIDSKNQNTLYKLSVLYFIGKDCKNALKYYLECKKYGGDPIDSDYEKTLNEKCKS